MSSLTTISPIDGRYAEQTQPCAAYFSEHAIMRYRAYVEMEYLIALAHAGVVRKLSAAEQQKLRSIAELSLEDAAAVKRIEAKTAHDVKALEYFLREKVEKIAKDLVEFVHFGLTAEDVNNLAYGLAITAFLKEQYLPAIRELQMALRKLALQHAALPMLGRTHGQPASPTTLGKELAVFVARLHAQFPLPQLTGKLNSAVGNFNAHALALPNLNWLAFAEKFVSSLGLKSEMLSTQVLSADALAALLHQLSRINIILIDLCRDIWWYCSHGSMTIRPEDGEVGSSTMPHKVNPIMFENAEGNLLLANSLLQLLAGNLPTSRLQRDLVGSTLQRNIGVAFAHTLIALQNIHAGLSRIAPNAAALKQELADHPEVLAEAIQTVLRLSRDSAPYEKLKQLTRGKAITLEALRDFVRNAKMPEALKQRLLTLTPAQYTGLAEQLCRYAAERAEIK